MLEVKQNQAVHLPIRLLTTSGTPVTGKTNADVTITVEKADGTTTTLVGLTGADFFEVTTGAFSGAGKYTLVLGSAHTNVLNALCVAVSVTGAKTFILVVKVVANEEADTYARLGAPAGASLAADLASNTTSLANIYSRIGAPIGASISADIAANKAINDLLKKYAEGRKKIHKTGGDANRMVQYDPADNTTVLKKWDMKDADGNPTYANPYDIIPV